MRLTVVGCTGSMPGPDAPASCYLVEAGDTRVLLDLGSGAFGPLRTHVDPRALDAVLLSHLHADHCLDLCALHVDWTYGPDPAGEPLPVRGPRGTAERLARAYDTVSLASVAAADHPAGPYEVGELRVLAVPVPHPVPAFGLRLEHRGRVLAYTGDTGPSHRLSELAQGADVLLAEASFSGPGPHPPDLHLSATEAGELAARAAVGRLVTTHVPPWGDPERAREEAAAAFGGEVLRAHAGLVVDI